MEKILHHGEFNLQNTAWTNIDFMMAAEYLQNTDVPGAKNGRFKDYEYVIHRYSSEAPRDVRSRRLLHEAYTSIAQSYFAVLQFPAIRPSSEQIRQMFSGAAGAGYGAETGPWDIQFELFCLALLRMAGLADVQYAEPDLIVPAGDRNLGFAIKRVTSDHYGKLRSRVRDAVRQLRAHTFKGVVIVEIASPSLDLISADIGRWLEDTVRDLARDIGRYDTGKRTLALLVNRFQLNWDYAHRMQVLLNTHVFNAQDEGEGSRLHEWLTRRGRQLMSSVELARPRRVVSESIKPSS